MPTAPCVKGRLRRPPPLSSENRSPYDAAVYVLVAAGLSLPYRSQTTKNGSTMPTITREQEIIDLETQFWNAIRDGDAASASSVVSEPCLVTGAQGHAAIDRKTFAKMMEAPAWTLHEVTFDKANVIFPKDDVAIIAYTVTEQLT